MVEPDVERLLFTDADGRPADVDDVIADGLDGIFKHRMLRLRQLVEDDRVDPLHRWQAVLALASWGDEFGFRAIIEAARDPERVVWAGVATDRFFSVDNTFAYLAQALWSSDLAHDASEPHPLRVEATRALLEIADRVNFEQELGVAVSSTPELLLHLAPDIAAAVERGVARLAVGERPQFDLATQLASLLDELVQVDEREAVRLAIALMAQVDGATRPLRELTDLVAHGTGSETMRLARELAEVNSPAVDELLDEALAARAQRATAARGDTVP